jgi:hypothetical protein
MRPKTSRGGTARLDAQTSDAILAQQADVMDAIQRLRASAGPMQARIDYRADGYVRPQDLHPGRPRPPKRRPWRRNAPRGRGWWRTRRPEVRCFALKHDIALFGVSTTANPDKTWRGVPDATHRLSPSCANNPNLLSLSAMGIGRQCTTRRLAARGTDRELS